MAKKTIAETTTKLFELLGALDEQERPRVIAAALTLLGDQPEPQAVVARQSVPGRVSVGAETTFFNSKQPTSRALNKMEQLAVAARFREQHLHQNAHTKDELEAVFREARRNFDGHNFSRDMDNAKKGGLFTRGRENALAYYGQQYVDALPNLEVVKALRRPKKKGKKRKTPSTKKR